MRRFNLVTVFRAAVFIVLSLLCESVGAQVRPAYDNGFSGLARLVGRLDNAKSVMLIGAHPDDENSALLAYLSRRENARTAYLSLTRGDGGQSLIGAEFGEALGLVRTEELLQARRFDGAEQYFTRAYDFGFSKSLIEARSKWPENLILCDMVSAIRSFRPQVVISEFSGTPADGHGQHQFAGYISPIAVAAANDANLCAAAGQTWQVQKFYIDRGTSDKGRLAVNTGEYDFLLGKSYFEIAMEGRSQHKSQGQGRIAFKGRQVTNLELVTSLVGSQAAESSVFSNLAARNGELSADISAPAKLIPRLADVYKAAADSRDENRRRDAASAIMLAAGVQMDALASRESVSSGESFEVSVRAYIPNTALASVASINLAGDESFEISPMKPSSEPNTNRRRDRPTASRTFVVTVTPRAEVTQPYWLVTPRQANVFTLPSAFGIMPFQAPELEARVWLEAGGRQVEIRVPVEFRLEDEMDGEKRRDFGVVPAISLKVDPELAIVPVSPRLQRRRVAVTITNLSESTVKGQVKLSLQNGGEIAIVPVKNDFEISGRDEKSVALFDVTIPPGTSTCSGTLLASASVGGKSFDREMRAVSYRHIRERRFYRAAAASMRCIDLVVKPSATAYVAGSGDGLPAALDLIGVNAKSLDEKELLIGDLSNYSTIFVGIRASEVVPGFRSVARRLLKYVENGGTLIVLYQRPGAATTSILPFPTEIGPRVVDENSIVTLLEPGNPVLASPNKITAADFEGWVQDRNLYNFSGMDKRYVPLLETHDEGEPTNAGSLVFAYVGKGKYVYCSLALFRQLPAGVPGAYRLLANLASLGNK